MKKKGPAKATATGRPSKMLPTPTDTPGTGDKRQLPLDFSRHAVNVKKGSPSPDNATNNESQVANPDLWRPLTFATPPTIHVNLIPGIHSGTLGCGSVNSITNVETGSEESLTRSTMLSNAEDQEDQVRYRTRVSGGGEDDNGCDDADEEDDGDDLLHASRQMRSQERQNEDDDEGDNENETNSKIKTEECIVEGNSLKIKLEPEDGDRPAMDMILPTQYRWKTVYVAAFELALDTVLPEESLLFTDEEHTLFETYRSLPGTTSHNAQL